MTVESSSTTTGFTVGIDSTHMERRTIAVSGLSCDGCEQAIENALRNLEGVRRIDADHEEGAVEIDDDDDISDDELGDEIRNAGYEVVA